MPKSTEKRSGLTVAQSVITGSVAGATEVMVDHPLWTIKTRMQRGDPFTLNPRVLYRGILPNAASMIPITGIQVGLDRFFQGVFFAGKSELTNAQRISSAFAAGVGSAFVSCPTEMVMTHQKKTGFYTAGKDVLNQGGGRTLFRGLPATMLRDGKFTAFFLAGTSILKRLVQPYCSNDFVASLTAGIGSGVGATVATQAYDTIKTVQQSADLRQHASFQAAAKALYAKGGLGGFFKGIVPRGARVVSAVTIMGLVTGEMKARFQEHETEMDHAPEMK